MKKGKVKNILIIGLLIVSFIGTIWALHLEGQETSFENEMLTSIRSKERIQTVTLIDQMEEKTKEIELDTEGDIEVFFDCFWKQKLVKKKTIPFDADYLVVIRTDADKEYELSVTDEKMKFIDQSYDVPEENELMETLEHYFTDSVSLK